MAAGVLRILENLVNQVGVSGIAAVEMNAIREELLRGKFSLHLFSNLVDLVLAIKTTDDMQLALKEERDLRTGDDGI